ncbi:hypothetical protein GCM10011405_35650 [Rufibacter glacialis]|nr:hypothetical protein GCM10011405_35650 [Rufibacter glacialis]
MPVSHKPLPKPGWTTYICCGSTSSTLRLRVIFFAAYLFLGSLLPNSDLHELSKISFLLQHYQTHQALNGPLRFVDFLDMHYQGEENTRSENHDQLPLKQLGNSAYDFFVAMPLLQSPLRALDLQEPQQYTLFTPSVPDFFTGSIWQPPQLA